MHATLPNILNVLYLTNLQMPVPYHVRKCCVVHTSANLRTCIPSRVSCHGRQPLITPTQLTMLKFNLRKHLPLKWANSLCILLQNGNTRTPYLLLQRQTHTFTQHRSTLQSATLEGHGPFEELHGSRTAIKAYEGVQLRLNSLSQMYKPAQR